MKCEECGMEVNENEAHNYKICQEHKDKVQWKKLSKPSHKTGSEEKGK